MTLRCLQPGDRVGVIAPAGPAAPERIALVEPLFARFGLRAKLYPSCHASHPAYDFLAGDDALRLADVHAAFADAGNAAVFALRGGWGSARLLPRVDAALLRASPKPFVGYSDLTALHALLVREGLPCFHGPMPASDLVQEGADDDARALFATLMQPLSVGQVFAPPLLPGHWHVPGRARGALVGGNLSIVASLLGTPWALPVQGAILFLEDVSEALYRVDRLLVQLRHAGVLDAVAGIVLGSFTEDDDPTTVLREHLAALGKPVLAGWPAGHGRPNRALPLGVRVALDATAGTLTLLEPVTELRP
ncbi:MAG TPA: LD-carboxypeptidase [Burkholderiaceae bacterium]|nr:LD-carboxypeptidase [Burkholderiaceae bacterium]